MRYESYENTPGVFTSENARLRVLLLSVIRSIVEQHGGTIEKDLVTNTVNISAPEGEGDVCAQKIEEQVGAMCDCIYAQAFAFFSGKIVVWMSNN